MFTTLRSSCSFAILIWIHTDSSKCVICICFLRFNFLLRLLKWFIISLVGLNNLPKGIKVLFSKLTASKCSFPTHSSLWIKLLKQKFWNDQRLNIEKTKFIQLCLRGKVSKIHLWTHIKIIRLLVQVFSFVLLFKNSRYKSIQEIGFKFSVGLNFKFSSKSSSVCVFDCFYALMFVTVI